MICRLKTGHNQTYALKCPFDKFRSLKIFRNCSSVFLEESNFHEIILFIIQQPTASDIGISSFILKTDLFFFFRCAFTLQLTETSKYKFTYLSTDYQRQNTLVSSHSNQTSFLNTKCNKVLVDNQTIKKIFHIVPNVLTNKSPLSRLTS